MTTAVEDDEVEASRAPLIEHLTELRSRLIKALVAFVLMFFVCFAGAKYIYNALVWPYVLAVGSPEKAHLVYTHGLEYLFTQIQVAAFGAGFLAFPVIAIQIYKFVAPGLYKNERRAFLPYLVATPVLFAIGASVRLFHRHAAAHALLGRHAAARDRIPAPPSSSCPRSASTCR